MRRLKGHIQKLGKGRWRVFATIRDADGKTLRPSKTVSGTREDAERALDRLLGMDGARPDCRFSDVIAAWLEHCEARERAGELAESTLKGYRAKMRMVDSSIGNVKCSELAPSRLNRFMDSLERDRHGTFRVLRACIRWAYRDGWLESDPTRRMEPVKAPKPKVRVEDIYTPEECAALLNHPMQDGLKTAVVLALSCGLRRGEICGLEWDDYDGERISVRRAWGKDRPKTDSSEADLSVPQWAREWLDERRGEGHVVLNGDGTPMRPDTLTRAWERLWTRPCGKPQECPPPVKMIPLKNLRHTSLSIVYEQTRDIKAASKRGRHSSTYITERFYVRPSKSVDESCADALDAVLGSVFSTS